MVSKNLTFWGESPQPAKTYYQMKLVCDAFGIIDHSKQGKESHYTYLVRSLLLGRKTQTILSRSFNISLIHTLTAGFEISPFVLIMQEFVRTSTCWPGLMSWSIKADLKVFASFI